MKMDKKQVSEDKKRFSHQKLMLLSTALVTVVISGLLLSQLLMQAPEVEFSYDAAIIDQVGDSLPSSPERAQEFNETISDHLRQAGFNVYYHNSKAITVDFFKGLAEYNYGLIILRCHSARNTDFFTSELFEYDRYNSERANGWILNKGNYSWEPDNFYFTITSEFVENMEGLFPKSIIIAMGCWSLQSDSQEMAKAFIKKGAEAYIGWTDAISMSHSDDSTIRFVQSLLLSNQTIHEAVIECNKFQDPWGWSGEFSFYPSEIGNSRLSSLTANAVLNIFRNSIQAFFIQKKKDLVFDVRATRQLFVSLGYYIVKTVPEHGSRES